MTVPCLALSGGTNRVRIVGPCLAKEYVHTRGQFLERGLPLEKGLLRASEHFVRRNRYLAKGLYRARGLYPANGLFLALVEDVVTDGRNPDSAHTPIQDTIFLHLHAHVHSPVIMATHIGISLVTYGTMERLSAFLALGVSDAVHGIEGVLQDHGHTKCHPTANKKPTGVLRDRKEAVLLNRQICCGL